MGRIVGQNFTLHVELRDEFGNQLLENRLGYTWVQAYFADPATGERAGDFLEITRVENGTFLVNVRSLSSGYQDLYVKEGIGCSSRNGVPCDFIGQSPVRNLYFLPEIANPVGTLCNPKISQNAGDTEEINCYPHDEYGNPVLNTKLVMSASFMKRTGEKFIGDMFYFEGTFDWKQRSYAFLPKLMYEGEYSVMVSVRSPGGLVAYYYRDMGFTTLVELLTTPTHTGLEYFSTIDKQIDFVWPGVPTSCPQIAAADFLGVYWKGFIVPDKTGWSPQSEVIRTSSNRSPPQNHSMLRKFTKGNTHVVLEPFLFIEVPLPSPPESFFDGSSILTGGTIGTSPRDEFVFLGRI